jgi:RNA polymerase sigma-70 factor (ECF subfamily)
VGKEAVARYEAALESLSPVEKEAVIGRIELGLSYRELAEALDKPTADAARMTVSRALVRLAGEMQE